MSNDLENINKQAYQDVLNVLEPQQPDNKDYMERYHFWRTIAGEKHFDPFYDMFDGED